MWGKLEGRNCFQTQSFPNNRGKIQFSSEIGQYGKKLIAAFQEVFTSANKNFSGF